MKYAFSPAQAAQKPMLQSDLQRLLSIIRERESSLVILFEEKKQKQWERPEWLLKECEYQQKQNRLSRQIRNIVLKWVLMGNQQNFGEDIIKQIRSFWVKVKMVMKMSLQRMKLLNLLNYQLFEQYECIIDSMNLGYDRASGISHYRDIEEMIKNRNRSIHDLLNCGSQMQTNRERYEMTVKNSIKQYPSDSKIKIQVQPLKVNKELITLDPKPLRRPLSHQNNKNQLNSKQFLLSRKIKKIEKFMSSYEEKINDVMSCKLELNLDKKKSLQQNLDTLHDQLMQKNISNHKTISKFIFSHSGRVFKRFSSKRQLKVPTKKLIQNESAKATRKQGKKKAKFSLAYDRAVSAKLKRKQMKQIHKLRHSQIFEGDIKIKSKKLLVR